MSELTSARGGSPFRYNRAWLQGVLLALAALSVIAIWQGPRHLAVLPAVNAALNGTAAVLLVAGYLLIKARRERAHTAVMLSAFVVSILFLVCYLVYHFALHQQTGQAGRPFPGTGSVKVVYLIILFTHIVLAAAVPFLAAISIYLGIKDRRRGHRRLSKWTLPIWLYVSVTGVVIYVMLYHLYPPVEAAWNKL